MMEYDNEPITKTTVGIPEQHRKRWRFYGRAVWVLAVVSFWLPFWVALPQMRGSLPLDGNPFLHTELLIVIFLLGAILLAVYESCGWLLKGYCFFRAETMEHIKLFAYYRSEAAKPVRAQVREHLFGGALAVFLATTLYSLYALLRMLL